MPKEYVQSLIETMSAYISSKFIPDIAELQINPIKISGDTLEVNSSLRNHEGYAFKIWFTNQSLQSNVRDWENGEYTSQWQYSTKQDTSLSLIKRDKTGKIVNTIEFVRVSGGDRLSEFDGEGYGYLANKSILKGDYLVFDKVGHKKWSVNFDPENKKITGYNFNFYQLQTDFGVGPEYKGDMLILSQTLDDYQGSESFAFKVKKDTIQLWSTREDTIDFTLKEKDLVFEMVKKKN